MKILVISNTAWDDSNSFGSTFSNIFYGIDNIEIANIYCRGGNPDNKVVKRYFQVTEKSIINNLKNSKCPSGSEIFVNENDEQKTTAVSEVSSFNFFRKHRLQLFLELREWIWTFGRWKSPELKAFLDDFDADIIFAPLYGFRHMLKLVKFVKAYTGKKMVTYMADDGYTMKQLNFSPLFWLDRLRQRKLHRDLIKQSETLYVISQKQKDVYDRIFRVNSKILCKGSDFTDEPEIKTELNNPVELIYTGNIGTGRWKTLAAIGRALDLINKTEKKAELLIYSQTPMNEKMSKSLDLESVRLMGAITQAQVTDVQRHADVLVHVESFTLQHRLHVMLSFSTKLVDYFKTARCIFAVGPEDVASMNYLIRNDAAVCATSYNEIEEKLSVLVNEKLIINEYAEKCYECGRKNHQISEIQKNLYNDFVALTGVTE